MSFDTGAGASGAGMNGGGAQGGMSQGTGGGSGNPGASGGSESGGFQSQGHESMDGMGSEGGTSQQEIRKWKVKAEGREHEWTEDELISHAQKGFSSDRKWQEAARKAEQADRTVEYILNQLRTNPVQFLQQKELGVDASLLKGQFERALSDELESKFDPEGYQRRMQQEADQRELESYRADAKRRQQAQIQAEDKEFQRGWDKRVREHFQANQKVPLSNFTYNSAINYIEQALRSGYRDVTMDDVMPLVERDWIASHQEFFKLPEDQLLAAIGDEGIKKIQAAVIARARKGGQPGPGKVPMEPRTKEEPSRMMTWEDNAARSLERMRAAGIL